MRLRALDIITLFYSVFVIVVIILFGSFSGAQQGVVLKFLIYIGIILSFACARAKVLKVKTNNIIKKIIMAITDWHYIILCIMFYSSLPQVNQLIFGRYFDEQIVSLEQFFFGSLPSLWLKDYFSSQFLMELVHVGYFSYYLLIPVLGIPLYLREDKSNFSQFFFIIIMTFIGSYFIYVIYPVSGPCYIFKNASVGNLKGYLFTDITVALHNAGSVRAAAFPSSHVAVATSFILSAYKYNKIVFKLTLPLVILLFFGTFYPGYHFVIDAFAGILFGTIIYFSSFKFSRFLTQLLGRINRLGI